jgi:hypothetical protein
MTAKKILVFSLILMLTAYPVSAGDVTLNRWVLNVTLHDDGLVEEVIQVEIDNGGSLPLDGFSFVVPATAVTTIYDFSHTQSFTGMVVDQQTIPGGVKVTVNFNSSVDAGKNWDGRIGFTAQNWALKDGSNYSINIPVNAPQAIVSGQSTNIAASPDADIRSQVFLPESVEVTSVTPKPFRILFQFDKMVPTWSPDTLHPGDTISLKGSFSSVLNKIVETDKNWRELKSRINETEGKGINVSEAKEHLNNADQYNTNLALQSYWEKNYTAALQFNGYANDELKLGENSLSSSEKTALPTETAQAEKSPGFEIAGLILVLLISRVVKGRK